MQTLNVCLSFDTAAVIQFAAAACRAASLMSYHFESTSSQEIVKLVEHVLHEPLSLQRHTLVVVIVAPKDINAKPLPLPSCPLVLPPATHPSSPP
jgi:hypothetical protein